MVWFDRKKKCGAVSYLFSCTCPSLYCTAFGHSLLLDVWSNYAITVSKIKDTSFEIKSFMCVKLVYMCKVVHVRQSSLCAFVVSLMNQQQKTSKAINYFNWKVLIYCVLSVGRKWVCGPSPLIQHAFQCKNQFGFSRHLSNWRYLEVLYFHVR